MSLDKHIQQELANESANLNRLIDQDKGLFSMLGDTFSGNLRGWMMVVFVVTLIFTALLIWCGYQFFTATTLDDRVFWGICFFASLFIQAMLKLWSWMEINRVSIIRAITQLELQVLALHERDSGE